MCIVTARKRSLGQGNIFSSVCQEFCSRGGLPQCMLGYHHHPHPPPQEQTPPRSRHFPPEADNPPPEADPSEAPPPRSRHPPGADPPPEADTPLEADTPWSRHTAPRKQTPPCAVHAGRYRQQAYGMHPTGMQSCWFFRRLRLNISTCFFRICGQGPSWNRPVLCFNSLTYLVYIELIFWSLSKLKNVALN